MGPDRYRKLAALDLNLLNVFRAVDDTRHVTQAARLLGITQPALSHALNRLRQAFQDPLFVKSSTGMVPTPQAERLAPRVREILSRIEIELLQDGRFEAKSLQRTFRLKTTDLTESLLLPKLIEHLQREAPQVAVVTTTPGFALPRHELESGECDLAIGGFFGELPDGFFQQKLYRDEFLCAVRADHPRFAKKSRLTLDDYCGARHLLITPGGELTGVADRELKKRGASRVVVAGASSFAVSGWITAQTDCLLTAPSLLLRRMQEFLPLKTYEPPFDLPRITVVQAWHERNHRDPAHQWFRDVVRSILQAD